MRALIIEDEHSLNTLLARTLREDGFTVNCTNDGLEGLHEATGFNYDVVVLDMLLPGKNGQIVLEQLRRDKNVPVMIISAINDVKDRVAALDAGADDYLVKPFDLDEFVARVRALIRRARNHPVAQFKFGSIVVDTLSRRVLRNQDVINLTPREYSLIELLASHCGQVVSRSVIYQQLFDDEDDPSISNLIDVHMSNLRKKLGTDRIRTVRGYGYIIDEERDSED